MKTKPQLACDRGESLIYGRKPVLEMIRSRASKIRRVFVAIGAKLSPEVDKGLQGLRDLKISILEVPASELDLLCQHYHHQGLAAIIEAASAIDLDGLVNYSLSSQGSRLLLALDQINDPHNLGAIFRVAEAVNLDGLILTESRSCPVTESVRKVSAGASEFMRWSYVKNLSQALTNLRERGFWIAGTALEAATESQKLQDLFTADLPLPLVIVFGSEGRGLRRLTLEHCDYLLNIPMLGRIQSLNVSHSVAVVLYEMVRRAGNPSRFPHSSLE